VRVWDIERDCGHTTRHDHVPTVPDYPCPSGCVEDELPVQLLVKPEPDPDPEPAPELPAVDPEPTTPPPAKVERAPVRPAARRPPPTPPRGRAPAGPLTRVDPEALAAFNRGTERARRD
jgi:hypothetical protein